jgi:polyferredoxin
MGDTDYTECLKCIECIKSCENKNESIFNHFIVPQSHVQATKLEDLYRKLWSELEFYLKAYQDLSNKHKWLYQHVKTLNSARVNKIEPLAPATTITKALIGIVNNSNNALMNRKIYEA